MTEASKKNRFDPILQPVIEGMGLEYVGYEFMSQGRHSTLRIYIDHESGVTIDHCTQVTRQLDAVLNVEEAIPGHYRIEVSSPGLERPLFKLVHFERFIGKPVKMKLYTPVEGQSHFQGSLDAVQDDKITLSTEEGSITVPFSEIVKANLIFKMEKKEKRKL